MGKRIFFEKHLPSQTNFWRPCIFFQTTCLLPLHKKGITNFGKHDIRGKERDGKYLVRISPAKTFDSFYYAFSLSAAVIGSSGSSLLTGTTGEIPIQITRGINKNRRTNSEEVLFS
ncbi:hypothetical protein CEXT_730991 [Caerostris extrusa]|uniref:Uncharacterized protein n=1 Tax=Caerostris extrusa TaxID=172846 RepID=A0AAV4MPM0_CAEEX|nr:hypothetical protein CEXT_730991 [Caerostris extrusa]